MYTVYTIHQHIYYIYNTLAYYIIVSKAVKRIIIVGFNF